LRAAAPPHQMHASIAEASPLRRRRALTTARAGRRLVTGRSVCASRPVARFSSAAEILSPAPRAKNDSPLSTDLLKRTLRKYFDHLITLLWSGTSQAVGSHERRFPAPPWASLQRDTRRQVTPPQPIAPRRGPDRRACRSDQAVASEQSWPPRPAVTMHRRPAIAPPPAKPRGFRPGPLTAAVSGVVSVTVVGRYFPCRDRPPRRQRAPPSVSSPARARRFVVRVCYVYRTWFTAGKPCPRTTDYQRAAPDPEHRPVLALRSFIHPFC
jgi:hypothetical protein